MQIRKLLCILPSESLIHDILDPMTRTSARGGKVDRDAVYLYCWNSARGRGNTLNKTAQVVADELGITLRTMQTVVAEFIDDGRFMRKHNRYFMTKDPSVEKWGVEKDQIGVVQAICMHFKCEEADAKAFLTFLHDNGWGVLKL